MIRCVANHHGQIHHAAGHADLQQIRPLYAFVPQEYYAQGGFDRRQYLSSPWPSINAGANSNAIGSHVIPDLDRPANPHSECPVLTDFLVRIETIAAIKTARPT